MIRLHGCAGRSRPLLSAFARRHIFTWHGRYGINDINLLQKPLRYIASGLELYQIYVNNDSQLTFDLFMARSKLLSNTFVWKKIVIFSKYLQHVIKEANPLNENCIPWVFNLYLSVGLFSRRQIDDNFIFHRK